MAARSIFRFLALFCLTICPGQFVLGAEVHRLDGTPLTNTQINVEVARLMKARQVPGLAVALIEDGRPIFVKTFGLANVEKKKPLTSDTILYAASLTKLAFTYAVMQLVDLANDERWRKLTPRILLDHTTGFQNFRFINPDGKLDFKFDPGTRYAYSGEGINLLQFVLETGLGLEVGHEMQRRVFDRFGMKRTSMTWREDFAPNYADGYDAHGKREGHHQRENVRAAGSMDTTIEDAAKFLAGFLRGEGLSTAARAENLMIGIPGKQRGLVLLSNSILAETVYPALVKFLWGETRLPWSWEYHASELPPPIPAE